MSLKTEDIADLLNRQEQETKALKREIFKLAWFMRGGVTLDEMYSIGFEDREIIAKIIDDNLETTKESGLPFF